jgi:signal transduction histidine kinase
MKQAPIPADDYLRVQHLHTLDILDSPPEDEFNDIVLLAARLCNTPISYISFLDENRQWFKAKVGVEMEEIPRDISFCGHAIVPGHDFFEVTDTLQDERFFDNPLVISMPDIRFYAGVQLVCRNGYKVGMLCVSDTKPNKLTDEQIFALKVLGNQVTKLLELRIIRKKSEEKTQKIESQNDILKKMLYIIAHDVRGPIGSLKNFFELSQSEDLDKKIKQEFVKMSVSQIDNTLRLLNNLVDWGNIQARKETNNQKVFMHALVEEEIKILSLAAIVKNNRLINLISHSMEFRSDVNMIKFVIRNLLANANKYTKNGTITVYSDFNDQFDRIIIHDTGMGMSEDIVRELLQNNNIFSTNGTSNEQGSGLGFKLVKDFIEKIDGHIDIDSTIGEGTSIILFFPRV